MKGVLHFCLTFLAITSVVTSQKPHKPVGTMGQLYLKLDSYDDKGQVISISETIQNALSSNGGTVDDLYLTFDRSDLNDVNQEIVRLYDQQHIKRHHIEFSDNSSLDKSEIPKYVSLLRLSGYSVKLKSSSDVIQLFSVLHTMESLQTVKLTMAFETTENIDDFYEKTLSELPSNSVVQLSVDRFLPYAVMFKVIRAFIQQSPRLERIILYSTLTPNALQHFRSQYVSEVERLVKNPLAIYVRPLDESVFEEHFGLVLLKSLSSLEEIQFGREYPFYVDKVERVGPNDGEL